MAERAVFLCYGSVCIFFYFALLCIDIKANFIVLHDSGVNSFCT